jgi:hypothetical protein
LLQHVLYSASKFVVGPEGHADEIGPEGHADEIGGISILISFAITLSILILQKIFILFVKWLQLLNL